MDDEAPILAENCRACAQHITARSNDDVAALQLVIVLRAVGFRRERDPFDLVAALELGYPLHIGRNLDAVAAILELRGVRAKRNGIRVERAHSLRIARIAEDLQHDAVSRP